MTALPESEPRTLIDELLAEQQALTAVERFSRQHERDALPAQARYYRDLIPLSKPLPGEQYAFAVDLDLCTGCKACVSACHSLNGLEEDEIWRNIGLLHGGTVEEPYQQTVTTACHHCAEPGCLLGCPVRAYEKDAETGIVRHLDDQCIGCQYCVLKCPYEVPKYSEKLGIVRKCDMCYGRLSVGEAPACVQSCPSAAITIRTIQTWELTESIQPGDELLPGAFDSSYTKPTTTYTSRNPMPANTRPGDAAALRLEHAHWPLVWMLVLTQLAAGMYLGAAAMAVVIPATFATAVAPIAAVAFVVLNLGLGVSVLHLGRPLGAWRAFLGLRTSWMSREIFAFSFFAAPAAALTVASWWDFAASRFPQLRNLEILGNPTAWSGPLALLTAALGVLGVICSAMIYVDTRRPFWRAEQTFTKFFGSTLVLGFAALTAVLAWMEFFHPTSGTGAATGLATLTMVLRTSLFGWEFQSFRNAWHDPDHADHRSAVLAWKLLRPQVFLRLACFAGATLFGLLAIAGPGLGTAIAATLALALTFGSRSIERYFFFTTVVAPRMPGGVPGRNGNSAH